MAGKAKARTRSLWIVTTPRAVLLAISDVPSPFAIVYPCRPFVTRKHVLMKEKVSGYVVKDGGNVSQRAFPKCVSFVIDSCCKARISLCNTRISHCFSNFVPDPNLDQLKQCYDERHSP